jgi:hypothetical protein
MSFPFLRDIELREVAEDSTTSVSADLAELSEGEVDAPIVHPPDAGEEGEQIEEEEEEQAGEVEEEETEETQEEAEEVPELDTHPFERPSLKSVEEAFPGLLKKFPSLRDMYFREAEYSKIFPTIDDAKEANENNTAFNSIRDDVFNGNGSKFFTAIKEVEPKNLERFSQTILSTLFQTHPQAFWNAANPLVEDIARNMFAKGTKEGNESLQNAARYLSDYFFGNTEIAEGKKTSIVKIEGPDPKINEEREKFENERHTAFRGGIETSVRSNLVKLIEGVDPKTGKSRLDPDGIFSPFIKNTILDKVIEDLGAQLTADKDHIRFMDSLWAKAKRNGRTDEDKARIMSAYLARAKSLIPTLRSKYVSEALGQNARVASGNKKRIETSSRTDGGTLGRGSNGKDKNYNPKSINYNKTSDADILNDNITYKN